MSTSTDVWPPRPRSESLFVSPHEPSHAVPAVPRARPLARIAVVVIVALAVQGGVFWQLHRSAAAKRRQVAAEMHDFEARAGALRGEMDALRSRLGQIRAKLDRMRAQPAPAPTAAPPATAPRERPPAPVAQRPRPPGTTSARPAPIVLSPGCADTPLGC